MKKKSVIELFLQLIQKEKKEFHEDLNTKEQMYKTVRERKSKWNIKKP